MKEEDDNIIKGAMQAPLPALTLTATSSITTTSSTITVSTTTTEDHTEREFIYPANLASEEVAASLVQELGIQETKKIIEVVERSNETWDEIEFGIGIFKFKIKRSPKKEIKYFSK